MDGSWAMSDDEATDASRPAKGRRGEGEDGGGRSWSAWIAGGLVLALVGWMASGMLGGEEPAPVAARRAAEPEPVAVEVLPSVARPITRALTIEGEVRPELATPVRAEAGGVVDATPTPKGSVVEEGDVLARIAPAERSAQLAQARAEVERTRRDLDRVESLLSRGFATQARVEESRAALAGAEAALAGAEATVGDLVVRAPAAGVLNDLMVDPGEVVQPGEEVARIVDTDPLVVKLRVPQRSVDEVEVGQRAEVAFVTGQERVGRVRYVSANAEAATRTFAIEVEVPNPGREVPAGISAEVRLPVEEVPAHFVSPAILSLGADGALGVKTVDGEGRVAFFPVDLVRAQPDGIWVAGLPEEARIITVGQGFVAEGEVVRAAVADDAGGPLPEGEAAADADATTVARAPDDAGPDGSASAAGEADGSEAPVVVVRSDGPEAEASDSEPGGSEPEARAMGGTDALSSAPDVPEDIDVTLRTVPITVPGEEAPALPADAAEAAPPDADPGTAAPTAAEPAPAEAPAASPTVLDATLAEDPAAAIRSVQERLNALGYEVGQPTGEQNARTRLALARFQEANGLKPTGEMDPRVLEALASEGAVGAAAAPAAGDGAADEDADEVSADRDRPADEADAPADAPEPVRFADDAARARAVRAVQEALNARGFDAGPVDGLFGDMTSEAVAAFQEVRGLPVTGEIDAPLLAALDLPTP